MSECVIKGDFNGYSDPNNNSHTESSCSINGNLNISNLPNLPDDFKATCSSSYYNNLQKDTLKKINNTVRVPSSLYMMNIASLNATNKYAYSGFNYWNNLSDRKEKHKQQVVVPTRGNSLKRSVTSLRPGALSPGGQGVDVKHGSYDRYLNKLKGKKIFRSVNSNSERLIIDCKCEKI